MKKQIYSLFSIFITALALTSCATAITEKKYIDSYKIESGRKTEPIMEFIGYKADSTILSTASETVMSPFDQWKAILQTDSLRTIGTTLQNESIAIDKSFAYFGIYSLQELEVYKTQSKYVTFIEVAKNQYTIDDNGSTKRIWGIVGGSALAVGIVYNIIGAAIPSTSSDGYYTYDYSDLKNLCQGVGIAFDIGGLIGLIPAMSKSRTKSKFEGLYNIYIYDTQTKKIIYKDAVSVRSEDDFTGSYFYDEASKNVVHEYYGTLIYNALLRKFEEINRMLQFQN